MIGEAVLLAGCGLVYLSFPTLMGSRLDLTAPADTYIRRTLGIVLIAFAIPLIHLIFGIRKFTWLAISYCFSATLCLLAIAIAWVKHGLFEYSFALWPAIIVVAVLAIVSLLFRLAIAFLRQRSTATLSELVPPVVLGDPKIGNADELRMRYAWDWFQYHADQRLKAFNYFVVALGFLLAAYGTAMKDAAAFPLIATVIAGFGAVISFAFLCIEVRNHELVEVGRMWLDQLEKSLGMSLREDDRKRKYLPKSVGSLTAAFTPPKSVFSHKLWFRVIYCIAGILFIILFFFSLMR